jgi:hypothetical protein
MYVYTCMYVCIHICMYIRMFACMCVCVCVCSSNSSSKSSSSMYIHTYTNARAHSHTKGIVRYHTHTNTQTHKQTHTNTHTQTHTPQVLLTDFHGEHEQFVVTNGTILSARGASGLFPLLQNLQDNVARSAQGDVTKGFVAQGDLTRDVDVSRDVDVRTASLDWATPQSSLGTFDFIAGSDCVYALEAVEPLAATIFRSAVSFSFSGLSFFLLQGCFFVSPSHWSP